VLSRRLHRDLWPASLLADRQVRPEASPARRSANPGPPMTTPRWSDASTVNTRPSVRPSVLERRPVYSKRNRETEQRNFGQIIYTPRTVQSSQLIFVRNFVKNQRILIQFSLLDLAMNNTCGGINFTPHLIHVATLHCESRNSENVIQWDITKSASNVSYIRFIEMDL